MVGGNGIVGGSTRVKVLISGSAGTIGRVLERGLPHEVTGFDLPEHDARSEAQLAAAAVGHDALVHLAWNASSENADNGAFDVENSVMVVNAYRAAQRSGVRRVVMASSVHADRATPPGDGPLIASGVPWPRSPYGASKVFAEALGRHYADQGLEVVAVRFGGVDGHAAAHDFRPGARPPGDWLSHADCVSLVNACLTAPVVPERFAVLYAVSDNPGRVHDLTNPFGWRPEPWSRRRAAVARWRQSARRLGSPSKRRVVDRQVRRDSRPEPIDPT